MMNGDTKDFLRHLLFCADNLDGKKRPLKNKTVFNFSVPFVNALEEFLAGFREFIEPHELDLSGLNRTFGGSVYLSLSGHGAGFWDGDWTDAADKVLTPAAKGFGECNLFLQDDDSVGIM